MSGSSGKKGNGCPSSSSSSPESRLRETLQNLREIVNCTEQEIYAMLKECNMDPNEAVQRLLTQDTFHEVKSKRERKKEAKGTSAFRSNRVSSGRGVRGGTERSGQSTSQINSYYTESTHSKPVHKKETGASIRPVSSYLGSGAAANNSSSWGVTPVSYTNAVGNPVQAPELSDRVLLTSQPSSMQNHNFLGARGELSMADIVKMGMPQRKPFNSQVLPVEVHNLLHRASPPNTSRGSARCMSTNIPLEANQYSHSLQDNVIKVANTSHELSVEVSQHQSLDEWTLVDHPDKESVSVSSANYSDPPVSSSLHVDGACAHISPDADDIQRLEGHIDSENLAPDSAISEGQERVDNADDSLYSEDGSFRNSNSYQHKAEDTYEELSLAASNLHHLNLQKEEQGVSLSERNPAVIIPDHLQVTNADFSHLSFGSFGSGLGASTSGTPLTKSVQRNLDTTSVTENALPVDHLDTRNPEYFNPDQLRTAQDDSAFSVTGADSRNYDVATSQAEVVGNSTYISDQAIQYNIPSVSNVALASTSQSTDAVHNHALSNSLMQNISPLSNLMQPYTDSVSSNLMAGNAQPRETGVPLLHLLANQSVPTKYSPAMSSLSASTISMSEVLNSGLLSTLQSNTQATPSTTISTGPALPARQSLPAYSQLTLPAGSPTNMISYPFHQQNVGYMPFSGSNALHQSPASLQSAYMRYAVPSFKSGMSPNGLPQSLPVGSGYGGFTSSTNYPGAFLQNPSCAPVGSAIGYEEALRSQYKETIPLHQGGNSSWLHGSGSRTTPSAAASTYYGLQDQTQQGSRIHRQAQQSPQMGMGMGMRMVGYPNYYNSQLGGISREYQQLISQGSLNNSQGSGQGQPSHQSHQLWQQGY